jgi:uncharacterized protein YmfQ (DUF2313 family)
MPLINASALDYLWQFQRLLPRGRVWQRGWGTLQAAYLLTLMPTWARLHASFNALVVDVFPCSTVGMLPEWEASLGLPDPCVQPPLATIQQRTAAVCAKFAARGGSSIEYFMRLGASLGYQIEIQTFKPFRTGQSRTGDRLYSEEWIFAWRINIQGDVGSITYFRSGKSSAGERLATWGIQQLQCILAEFAPANTIPIWAYQINSSIWDGGASIWDSGLSVWDEGVIVAPGDGNKVLIR